MSLLAAYLGSVSVNKGPGLEGVGMGGRSKDLDLGTAQKGKDQVEYVDHGAQGRGRHQTPALLVGRWHGPGDRSR